jgi:hypothetical protein
MEQAESTQKRTHLIKPIKAQNSGNKQENKLPRISALIPAGVADLYYEVSRHEKFQFNIHGFKQGFNTHLWNRGTSAKRYRQHGRTKPEKTPRASHPEPSNSLKTRKKNAQQPDFRTSHRDLQFETGIASRNAIRPWAVQRARDVSPFRSV